MHSEDRSLIGELRFDDIIFEDRDNNTVTYWSSQMVAKIPGMLPDDFTISVFII